MVYKYSFDVFGYMKSIDFLMSKIEVAYNAHTGVYIKVSSTVNSNSKVAHFSVLHHEELDESTLRFVIDTCVHPCEFKLKKVQKIKVKS